MAEYEELRTALRWLLLSQLAPMPRYMRGRLGNGQGKVKVPDRPDYSYVRPSRSTDDVIEVFNKEVSGGDGTPVLVGELPWQPGLTQIVSVDWETYVQVGWGDGYAGVALHGPTHEWRDGFVGTDAFNVFRRQIAPLRTYPLGSGSQSVYVSPYDYWWLGSPVSWCGLPGLDLSAATPATGQARLMLTYLDMESNVLGVVTGTIDVHSDAIELARPALPTGTWAPSAYVRLFGGQGTISESRDIRDARQLWNSASARPGGPAGGDLTGTYPNPTVRAIQGFPVSSATPNEGDLFIFTGSMWSPMPEPWMRVLPGATYRTLWDLSDTLQSASIISGGAISDNGDGTVAVTAGTGLIKTTDSDIGENNFFDWPANASVGAVTGTTTWIYVDYNAGTPQVASDTVFGNIDLHTEIVLGRVFREVGDTMHIIRVGQIFPDYMTKACRKEFEVEGMVRASGLATTEIGTRSIDVTAGVLYCAHNRNTTAHSTGTFSYWYRDGSGYWTEIANQMQINNANWDDGDGTLGTLTANRYGVHWVYMDYDGHLHVQFGQGDYTKAGANDAAVPATHPLLTNFALLIAKIIIQEGQATFDSITVPWVEAFAGASPVDHGDLAGLTDDDHIQYLLINGTRPMTGELEADLGISIPTAQELKIDDDEDTSIRCPSPYDDRFRFKIGGVDIFDIWVTGSNYWFHGLQDGYDWGLWGYDAGHNRKAMIIADPDDTVQLFYAGVTRFNTTADGISIPETARLDLDTDGDTSIRASADDQIDFEIGGTDLIVFDGEGIDASIRIVKTTVVVPGLQSANVAGQYFTDNDASYPAGWSEDDAAAATNTNTYFGMWYLQGTAADTSWQYSIATGFDLENDAAADEWTSWQFGPLFWSDGQWGADLDYTFGVYGTTGGVMDINTYNRVRLHWDSGTTTWQIRGETRAGATDTQTATAYSNFSFPLAQPIWVRMVIRNSAAKLCRNYVGTAYLPLSMTRMSNLNETTTWGDLYLMIEMDRGAGVNDYLFWCLVDNTNDS
jgi:hypothetical protein